MNIETAPRENSAPDLHGEADARNKEENDNPVQRDLTRLRLEIEQLGCLVQVLALANGDE